MAAPTVQDEATSAIGSSPDWILLDTATRCGKYRWESLASATALASTAKALVKYESSRLRVEPEVEVEVSFRLFDPPEVSSFVVRCRCVQDEALVLENDSCVVGAGGDVALLHVTLVSNRSRSGSGHYFVYRWGAGHVSPSSLELLPPPPATSRFNRKAPGILPRGGGGYVVAVGIGIKYTDGGRAREYELLLYSSRTKAWSTRLAPLDPHTDQNFVWSHRTDKVIAVGGDSLGWVNLWWGIVVCNLSDDEDFTTRFVPLPGPMPGNEHRFAACSARSLRDVVCVGDLLKFVEIHFHADDGEEDDDDGVSLEAKRVNYGWKATAWSTMLWSGDWHAGCTVDTDDIPLTDEMHSMLMPKLPEIKAEKLSWYGPTLSMDQDVFYMIFRPSRYRGHRDEWQVAVDMRKNALEIVSYTAEEKHFCDPTYRPIALSKNQPTSNHHDVEPQA